MNHRLENKVILITGGTTGIGRATAVLLAKQKAKVIIFGRHQLELNDALEDIRKLARREAEGFIADIAKENEIKAIFDYIKKKHQKLNILINNAAVEARSIVDTPAKEIEYILKVNLFGYILCSKMALQILDEKEGHIINIGSLSGRVREKEADLYVATKSGVEGFSDSLRKQINDKNIKLTLIEPGAVGTDLVSLSPKEQEKQQEKLLMLKAEDVASAILFSLNTPKRCEIKDIQIKPLKQII